MDIIIVSQALRALDVVISAEGIDDSSYKTAFIAGYVSAINKVLDIREKRNKEKE